MVDYATHPQYGYPPQPQAPAGYAPPAPGYAPPPPPAGYAPPAPQYGPPPGYPPQAYQPPQHQNYGPSDLQMPAPRYGGATDDALMGSNIEQELDSDQILNDYHAGNENKEDQYAQQVRLRAQQENQMYQQKIGSLEEQNQNLNNDVNYLKGQVETLASSAQSNQQTVAQQEQQLRDEAVLREFELTPEEKQIAADYGSALDKIVGKALYQQEKRLKQDMTSTLAAHTQQALSPVTEQLQEANTKLEIQERNIQNQFDVALDQALGMRHVTLAGLLKDPAFQAYGNQRIEGSNLTRLKIMREAAAVGNVQQVVEVVDSYLQSRGFNPAQQAAVPQMGNTPRMNNPQEAKVLQDRQQIASELETLEHENSIGNYDRFGGSRKKFLERRNELLQYLENAPLPTN